MPAGLDGDPNPMVTPARTEVLTRRKGERSALGFYEDSHDLSALEAQLLDPLRVGIGARYRTAVFDEPTDAPVGAVWRDVRGDEILLFDGIFLQRPELAGRWDLTIFLDGRARVELRRLGLVLDDLAALGADVDRVIVADRVLTWVERIDRYASGMQLYLDSVDPMARADVVIDNNDLANPAITALRSAS